MSSNPTLATAAFKLSLQQERAWSQYECGVPQVAQCVIAIEGHLDIARLERVLQQVVSKYEILRTAFRWQTGVKLPFQVIQEDPRFVFEHSANPTPGVAELLRREQQAVPDIEKGPALRALVVTTSPKQHTLVLTLPAFCADAATLKNVCKEIGTSYGSDHRAVADDVMQYADLAEWQNELLASEETKSGRDFWRDSCRGLDFASLGSVSLPLEKRQEAAAFSPDFVWLSISELAKRIGSLAAAQNASTDDVLLAAWNVLLFRLSGQQDIAIGCEFNGRRYEELEAALGPLARSLPLRTELRSEISVRNLLDRIQSTTAEARNWQESFAWTQISEAESPVLPFGFTSHDLGGRQEYGGVGFRLERQQVISERFKLRLSVVRRESELELEFHYDGSRLARATVEGIAGYYQNLLAAAVENPETVVGKLPLLPQRERRQLLVEWNQTAAGYPEKQCLQELFEQQAARTPERLAVRCGEQTLTYRELNEQSNQLAHYLRQQGVGPDRLVGLCLERSVETMVAVLAILKAGGAYVPLNRDNPPARLQQQLEGAVALITESQLAAQMPEFAGAVVVIDGDRKRWASQSKANPTANTKPENLVYVIYTSGSTGVPKGVAVQHRNLVNYAHFITQRLELDQDREGLQFATVSTLGADLGNTCIYPALISGGGLHIVGYEMATDPRQFAEYLAKYPVDVLKIVPSHLQALLQALHEEAGKLLPRKYLILGGETLTPKLLEKIEALNSGCEILNHYGPTETTVGSLTLKLKEYDWQQAKLASIPIGRPIQNTQVYILDQNLEPVPIGVTGELYIAGAGVTAGYLGQPEKTAERFLKNPFASDPEGKMYRTGDLARYGEDGNIEFLGRGDDQVKVRGFRIELGEIETVLARHESVKQSVVLAREDAHGDKRLVAYVVPSREQPVAGTAGAEELRAYLKQQLPDYMVPQAVVLLPKLPLTANGKIDRQALPEPEHLQTQRATIAPRNEAESVLLKVWQRVLNKEKIGVTDNFFDLGGHSLMAVQLMGEIKKENGKDIPLLALFQGATIEYLANLLRGAGDVDRSILREVQGQGSLPAFFAAVLPGVNALGYLKLSEHMGSDQPFYMLQAPGPGPRAGRRPYTAEEYEKVASDYIHAMRTVRPDGPYYLGGMCEGARIAFEMTRLLESQGQKVNLLAIMDTWVIENTQNRRLWKIYYYYRRLGEFWDRSWRSKLAMARKALRNRIQWWVGLKSAPPKSEWLHTYWPGDDFVPARVQNRITIFKAPKQPFYYHQDKLLGWGSRTASGVDIEVLPNAKHRLLLREPYVRELAAALSQRLKDLHSQSDRVPDTENKIESAEVVTAS